MKVQKPDEQFRMWQNEIRQIHELIAVKTLCFALPLLLIALVFLTMWVTEEPAAQWCTETVHFRGVQRESAGRRGSEMNWFVTMDGRRFATTREVIDAVDETLVRGAVCEVTYRTRLWTKSIYKLTSGTVVFVDRTEYEQDWEAAREEFLIDAAVLTGLATFSAALSYALWCSRDRQELAKLKTLIRQKERRICND